MAALILVVDDSCDALEAASRFLSHKGVEVVTTARVLGVTSLILRRTPDVIVLDVMMPTMSGSALAHIVRNYVPNTPIIFYSAVQEAQGRTLANEHRNARFVSKTHGVMALYRAVLDVLSLAARAAGS
jgi:DNA-binding response OmpR family regulator